MEKIDNLSSVPRCVSSLGQRDDDELEALSGESVGNASLEGAEEDSVV